MVMGYGSMSSEMVMGYGNTCIYRNSHGLWEHVYTMLMGYGNMYVELVLGYGNIYM